RCWNYSEDLGAVDELTHLCLREFVPFLNNFYFSESHIF
ncbi:zinc finger domain-containing protein, partial [Staphylococcus aureus]